MAALFTKIFYLTQIYELSNYYLINKNVYLYITFECTLSNSTKLATHLTI